MKNQKGEIATLLTLLSVGLMAVGIFAGNKLAQTGGRLNPLAAEAVKCGTTNGPAAWTTSKWEEANSKANGDFNRVCGFLDPNSTLCTEDKDYCVCNIWDAGYGCLWPYGGCGLYDGSEGACRLVEQKFKVCAWYSTCGKCRTRGTDVKDVCPLPPTEVPTKPPAAAPTTPPEPTTPPGAPTKPPAAPTSPPPGAPTVPPAGGGACALIPASGDYGSTCPADAQGKCWQRTRVDGKACSTDPGSDKYDKDCNKWFKCESVWKGPCEDQATCEKGAAPTAKPTAKPGSGGPTSPPGGGGSIPPDIANKTKITILEGIFGAPQVSFMGKQVKLKDARISYQYDTGKWADIEKPYTLKIDKITGVADSFIFVGFKNKPIYIDPSFYFNFKTYGIPIKTIINIQAEQEDYPNVKLCLTGEGEIINSDVNNVSGKGLVIEKWEPSIAELNIWTNCTGGNISTNRPPVIEVTDMNKPPGEATDGDIYTYQITASDPDNDPITYSVETEPKEIGVTIDAKQIVKWDKVDIKKAKDGTKEDGTSFKYVTIKVIATDSKKASSSYYWGVEIKPKGSATGVSTAYYIFKLQLKDYSNSRKQAHNFIFDMDQNIANYVQNPSTGITVAPEIISTKKLPLKKIDETKSDYYLYESDLVVIKGTSKDPTKILTDNNNIAPVIDSILLDDIKYKIVSGSDDIYPCFIDAKTGASVTTIIEKYKAKNCAIVTSVRSTNKEFEVIPTQRSLKINFIQKATGISKPSNYNFTIQIAGEMIEEGSITGCNESKDPRGLILAGTLSDSPLAVCTSKNEYPVEMPTKPDRKFLIGGIMRIFKKTDNSQVGTCDFNSYEFPFHKLGDPGSADFNIKLNTTYKKDNEITCSFDKTNSYANTQSPVSGSTNDKYRLVRDLYAKGRIDALAVSQFVAQATRYPGVQTKTLDYSELPQTYDLPML
ncbi:hypothetical protein MUP32_03770 [Candidatus Microgenomates bacterium]|nr:hypothetical protein [Candidatus Microgenomates bacterium]